MLLSSVKPFSKGVKWGLVVHTVALFSLLTVYFWIKLNLSSACYINNREYPGGDEYFPGPIGCGGFYFETTAVIGLFSATFPLNQWLVDGLLVSLISNAVGEVFNVGPSSSCTVAMSFIPRTVGSWPFRA